jgi:hypothetical protein
LGHYGLRKIGVEGIFRPGKVRLGIITESPTKYGGILNLGLSLMTGRKLGV